MESLEKMSEVYLSVAVIWYLLASIWGVNIFRFRKISATLQNALSIPIGLKVVSCTLFYIYWSQCDLRAAMVSESGLHCANLWLAVLAIILTIAYATVSIYVLILVSKGWSITRHFIGRGEKHLVNSATACFVLAATMNHLISWFLPALRQTVAVLIYLLFVLLTYIAILRLIFVSIDQNMRALKAQLYLIRQANFDPASTPAMDKFLMFRSFQRCMAMYVFLDILVVVLHHLLELEFWMVTLLNEVVELFLILGVCITFRVKSFNTYFSQVPVHDMDDVSVPQRLSEDELQGSGLPQWSEGDPLPGVPAYHFRRGQTADDGVIPQIVVVRNPDTRDANGKLAPSLSVGYLHDPSMACVLGSGSDISETTIDEAGLAGLPGVPDSIENDAPNATGNNSNITSESNAATDLSGSGNHLLPPGPVSQNSVQPAPVSAASPLPTIAEGRPDLQVEIPGGDNAELPLVANSDQPTVPTAPGVSMDALASAEAASRSSQRRNSQSLVHPAGTLFTPSHGSRSRRRSSSAQGSIDGTHLPPLATEAVLVTGESVPNVGPYSARAISPTGRVELARETDPSARLLVIGDDLSTRAPGTPGAQSAVPEVPGTPQAELPGTPQADPQAT